MTIGHIDSASLHGVTAALGSKGIDKCPPWTLQSITEVTTALVHAPSFEVAPGPGTYAGDYGITSHVMKCMAPVVSHSRPSPGTVRRATNRVKNWVRSRPKSIRKTFEEIRLDESYQPWLDYSIENYFVEHTTTLNGLFDRVFIPELALIFNCPQKYLRDVWRLTRDPKVVQIWSKTHPDNDEFKLSVEAFVVAALLRGRLHDHIAQAAEQHIVHHPIRYKVLPPETRNLQFGITDSEKYFNSIIVMSAFSEKRIEDRIAHYSGNIIRAQAVRPSLDLSQKDDVALARKAALAAAKKAELRILSSGSSRRLPVEIDLLFWITIDKLACFALGTWASIPVEDLPLYLHSLDGAATIASGQSVGKIITQAYSRIGLSKLADSVPGRLRGKWVQRG